MEKNLSQVLGESFKISETCKSVTRLDCFTNNSGTVKVLSILEIPIYLCYAKFSLTRCFECNQSAGESGSRSPLLPLPRLPPPLLWKILENQNAVDSTEATSIFWPRHWNATDFFCASLSQFTPAVVFKTTCELVAMFYPLVDNICLASSYWLGICVGRLLLLVISRYHGECSP